MSISKAQINWTAVEFGAVPITRITTASFGQGGSLVQFKGDTDLYPSIIANVTNDPHASITTADVGTMMGFLSGTSGTLTAQLNDAKAVADGAVVFTMSNAVFENADTQAAHAQFGSVTGTWQAYASDGLTNPVVITRV
jgi:hypothetical protein